MTEEDIRGLFREMREDSVPADSLARVRMRVSERTVARRWWKLAALVLAPVCLLVTAVVLRNPAPPPLRIELPVLPPVRVEPAVVQSRPRHIVRRAKRPVLIRIETPDPEVVILLVGN
jgi:hypothetical protein